MFDFALQNIEIGYGDALIFLNNYVACAKQAQAFAEGKMHVQRNRRLRALRFGVNRFQIAGAKGVIPDRRRWIAGVTRPGAIIAGEKFFTHSQFVAHALEAWSGERHGMILSANRRQKSVDWLWPLSRRRF